jgi:hypothetical protein
MSTSNFLYSCILTAYAMKQFCWTFVKKILCVWQREKEWIFEGCITACHIPYALYIIILKLTACNLIEHDDNKINVSKNSLLQRANNESSHNTNGNIVNVEKVKGGS